MSTPDEDILQEIHRRAWALPRDSAEHKLLVKLEKELRERRNQKVQEDGQRRAILLLDDEDLVNLLYVPEIKVLNADWDAREMTLHLMVEGNGLPKACKVRQGHPLEFVVHHETEYDNPNELRVAKP